jgi:hypothetical protein
MRLGVGRLSLAAALLAPGLAAILAAPAFAQRAGAPAPAEPRLVPTRPQAVLVTRVLVDAGRIRPVLQRLWDESVAANKERVACLGGAREGTTFRITRAAALDSLATPPDSTRGRPEFDADSMGVSRYLSELSVEVCRPPEWAGTIHTHRVERGVEYPRLSSTDRAVISLWHARWRAESVFCVLYTREKAPHCEYRPGR